MATQKGQAFIWGVPGLTATISSVSIQSGGEVQSIDYTRDGDHEYLVDKDGETVGRADFNKKQTLRVTVIPSDSSSISAARTNLAALLPTKGTIVSSVTDTDVTAIAGNWIVNSANISRSNRQMAAIDLELEKFDTNDITGTIAS